MSKIKKFFQNAIQSLPKAIIPFEGVKGWVLQGPKMQVVFFEIEPNISIPTHSHGNQLGMVVEGDATYTIEGKSFQFVEGDVYFVPEGKKHSAFINSFTRLIDFFDDENRYQIQEE